MKTPVIFVFIFFLPSHVHSASRDYCGSFRFANLFQNGMILQRGGPGASIWGFGAADEKLNVIFRDRSISLKIGGDCTWNVTLPETPAGGPYNISVNTRNNSVIKLDNVLFGDVWLCGGQSNMEFQLQEVSDGFQEMMSANSYPAMRLLRIQPTMSNIPLLEPAILQNWSPPSVGSLRSFSGVCWSFGRRLSDKLKIPIGLIGSYYHATYIRDWSPPQAIDSCRKSFSPELEKMEKMNAKNALGQSMRKSSEDSQRWNAMINPLARMRISAVLWYQGESEAVAGDADSYLCMLPAMINSWRSAFDDPDMTFGIIQISAITMANLKPDTALVRWHQTADLGSVPNGVLGNSFMAVTMDLGDLPFDPYFGLHSRYKAKVAERAALGALEHHYRFPNITSSGPEVETSFFSMSGIELSFTERLDARDRVSPNFEVCCEKSIGQMNYLKTWRTCKKWTTTKITKSNGNRLWLDGTVCGNDTASFVRYAWNTLPCGFLRCPLYGIETGLPTAAFVKPILTVAQYQSTAEIMEMLMASQIRQIQRKETRVQRNGKIRF